MIKIEELYCQVRDTVQNGNCLTQILFKEIRQVDTQTGAVLRQVECPNMGGLIGICALEGGFILHGETELFRYDQQLNRIWSFSGRDIFATLDGTKAFWIEADAIHCRDWLGWHYVLDLDGNLVSEKLEQFPYGWQYE